MIHIEPLTWHWNEWLPRIREDFPPVKDIIAKDGPVAAAKAMGDWQNELDEWLRSFDTSRRRSMIDLLFAEADMLYETIDPSDGRKPPFGESEWSDFRQRWHEAIPLALAAEREGFDRSASLVRYMRMLEIFAEQKNWLP